jgi:hypothetical protein
MRNEEGYPQQDERSVPSRGDRRQDAKNSASSTVTLHGLTVEREESKKRRNEGESRTVHGLRSVSFDGPNIDPPLKRSLRFADSRLTRVSRSFDSSASIPRFFVASTQAVGAWQFRDGPPYCGICTTVNACDAPSGVTVSPASFPSVAR